MWALPFLTGLAPSERYHQERGHRHKKLTDWARQLLLLVRRWLPGRQLVAVADSRDAVLDLLTRCTGVRQPITVVARLRLDAALDEPASPRAPGTRGRPRLNGQRLPTLTSRLADPPPVRQAAWYPKHDPTFADVLALVRRERWNHQAVFCMSCREADREKGPRALIQRLTDALCYAA